MSSKSSLSYEDRAKTHPSPLVKRLFAIAAGKKTNVIVSADVSTTKELLDLADTMGPYITVLKTHIDILSDFSGDTIKGLVELSNKHDFLIFEDRKFVDIGNTVQKQYDGGAFRIADWAHIVNAAPLAGPGLIDALSQCIQNGKFAGSNERGILILAEMTSKGSLAMGEYTRACVEMAQTWPSTVIGFVATRELSSIGSGMEKAKDEDFVIFTTGVNIASKGDALGQQYQTPESAICGGADFIIAGRGIYASPNQIEAVRAYQERGWAAYLARIGTTS